MNPTEPAINAKPVFGPATAVLALAVSGRWRAPETTAALAHQAAIQARSESDISTALLAEGWLLHGLLAVGRGSTGVARAVGALEDAGRSGNSAAEARLRVGLASVARELGDIDSASGLLAPVIERDIIDPELAVDAYLEVVRCGGQPVAGGAPAATDLAAGHIRTLRGEQVELGLAALDAALATQHRLGGRNREAVARAREGLRRLLGESAAGSELDPISPHLAATLSLELTRSLLDDGQPELACRVAEPALAWAGRPAALVPLTRLRLVLAERAYLPAGQYDAALRAVGWAADVVGDHDLPELEADCQSLLADVHERRGALQEALAASRRAHSALRTHSARVEQALVLLGRCAGGTGARPVSVPVAWDQGRYEPRQFDRGPGGAAPGLQRGVPSAPPGLEVVANNATVRLRSVTRQPSSAGSETQTATDPNQVDPVGYASGHPWRQDPGFVQPERVGPGPGDSRAGGSWSEDSWTSSGALGFVEAASGGRDRRDGEPDRYGVEFADERNARPAAAMASSSLDDWAAVTGWPGEPSTGSSTADTFGFRTVRPEFHRPEGIGAISAPGAPDAAGWTDAASLTSAFAPVERAEPAPIFDALGAPGVAEEPLADTSTDGDDAADGYDQPADVSAEDDDQLDKLIAPDEQRPLGLVAIDVVTPRGPLTGYVAKPLLGHIADHARAQLPPNAGLQVLSSDMVLVVLPPVEADVVSRWMRSLATRLSAGWAEYAADVPRSTYRVAFGAFDAEHSVHDNVEQLRARLAGVSPQAAADLNLLAGGGRHVARGRSVPSDGAGSAMRTSAEPGTGGRRRRSDRLSGSGGVAPGQPAAGPSGVAVSPATGGSTARSADREGGPSAPEDNAGHTERPYSRGRGIDRVALARLAQMAWRPPTVRPADGGGETDAASSAAEISGRTRRGGSAGTENGPAKNGHTETLLAGPDSSGNPVAGHAVSGNRALSNGHPEHRFIEIGTAENGTAENAIAENGTAENAIAENGTAENAVRRDEIVSSTGATDRLTPSEASGDSLKDRSQRPPEASGLHELSFAELLAGALAAYRDG